MQKKTEKEKLKIAIEFLAFEFDVFDNKNGTFSFQHHLYGWIDIFPELNSVKIRNQPYMIKDAVFFLKKKIILENLDEII